MIDEQKIIRNKVGLVDLAHALGNVSQACQVMGYSCNSFYRYKELYDQGGELALQGMGRDPSPQSWTPVVLGFRLPERPLKPRRKHEEEFYERADDLHPAAG